MFSGVTIWSTMEFLSGVLDRGFVLCDALVVEVGDNRCHSCNGLGLDGFRCCNTLSGGRG